MALNAMSTNVAFGTPTLSVRGNRGALVRILRYNRGAAGDPLVERVERTTYDAAGRVASHIDARFFGTPASPQANFSYLSSLTGKVLRTDSVDSGRRVALADVEGRPVWARDARDTVTTWHYDVLGRPLAMQESAGVQPAATRDVWIYGEASADAQAHNLLGRCVCRYDTAGRVAWTGFHLTGQPFDETRQLLADAEADADWKGQDPAAWAGALQATTYRTAWTRDATGRWVARTDAMNNIQHRAFDVAGRTASSGLTLAGGTAKPVLSAIDYDPAGQVLAETAGNGVVTAYAYEPETRRLVGLTMTRPAQAGRPSVVQDLSFAYDPVGNVIQMNDAAQATSYWRNEKTVPACTYAYDALYQLISATGRETANRGRQGRTLPPMSPTGDDAVYVNYSRAYSYDAGGNLATMQHRGVANYTQNIVISSRSNHAMLQDSTGTLTPDAIDDGTWFDAGGNQRLLMPDSTQVLAWDGRDRLRRVTLVKRSGPDDDREAYQYGRDGMRVRKRLSTQASSATRTVEAIYLPGLTLRMTSSGDGKTMTVVESLQEIVSVSGGIRTRCLHWDIGKPVGLDDDAMRYGFGDRGASVSLELDAGADLVSREEYYPYGGTAVWAARSQVEADTKFVRYSGKERDATGLYDYGYRYYQPWMGRWASADPAGTADGLNLYRMVRNNPITLTDRDGLAPTGRQPGSYDAGSDDEDAPAGVISLYDDSEDEYAEDQRRAVANSVSDDAPSTSSTAPAAPPPVEAPDAVAAARAMVAGEPWIPSETQFKTLWRADKRSPGQIEVTGFVGTNTVEHAITLHEVQRTVFSARTPMGVLKFLEIMDDGWKAVIGNIKAQGLGAFPYFLYKINPQGLRASSFQRNYDRFGENFIRDLALREIERRDRLGLVNFELNFLRQTMGLQIERAYHAVDEVHIQGPVTPDRISRVEADDPYLESVYARHGPGKSHTPLPTGLHDVWRAPDTRDSPWRRRANTL